MAFPQSPLDVNVELEIGGTWTDITSDVYLRSPISIGRGRADEAARVDAGKCTLTLNNRAGKYSPRNPTGPYYGQIGRNTPVRVSVNAGSTFLGVSGSAGCRAATPDHASLDVTGDIDIRIDLTGDDNCWFTGDTWEVFGKYAITGNQRSWRLVLFSGAILFGWSPDGTSAASLLEVSAHLPPPASGRLALRVTLDVDNGAGGHTTTFYTAPTMAGPWSQLGSPAVKAGTTSIFASTAPLEAAEISDHPGLPLAGRVHAAQVRSGIGGTIVANPDFTAQTPGATSFADSAGRTWTLAGDAEITNRRVRFTGEISSWPSRWDVDGKDVWVPAEASGILRRLAQGVAPLQSAMRRELSNPARTSIVAYWPCEDGTGATVLAPATAGDPAMQITGVISPGRYGDWSASAPLPTLGDGQISGLVPAYAATGETSLRFFVAAPDSGIAAERKLISLTGTGTAPAWTVWLETDGDATLRAYDSLGAEIFNSGSIAVGANGRQLSIGVELVQSGADVNWSIFSYPIATATLGSVSGIGLSGTLASRTVGQITAIRAGEQAGLGDTAIGHIALADDTGAYANTGAAMIAWAGELAQDRIVRLCSESEVPLSVYGERTSTAKVGPQASDTLLNLLGIAADTDGGLLHERADSVSLAYRNRTSVYSQPASLALNYASPGEVGPPLEPVDDDQHVRNDVTIKRDEGASARAVLEDGGLSVQAPPDGVGRYDTSVSLNLFEDSQCTDQAGWRLHLGTWDEPRYPTVHVDLAAGPHLITAATALDLRDLISIDNPPAWLPPDQIRLLVEGYTETIGLYGWDLVYNCSPAGPWNVATLDSDTLGRLDSGGSTLAAGATSTATSLSVASSGGLWSTTAAPFDVTVAGERMTVTAVAGAASPQTFTVTRSVNGIVKAQLSGATVRLFQPMILAL